MFYIKNIFLIHRHVKTVILTKSFAEIIELLQHYPIVDLRKIIKATLTINNNYKDANDSVSCVTTESQAIRKVLFILIYFNLFYVYFSSDWLFSDQRIEA